MIAIILVAIVTGTFFGFYFSYPIVEDALQYDTIAWNLANRNGYSLSINKPYLPTMNREPAYPIFLGGIFIIFGHSYRAVRIIQIAFFVLIAMIIYFITLKIFGEKIAKFSSFLVAFCPTLANFTGYLLLETLFTFLLCLTVLWLMETVNRKRVFWYIVTGTLLGILTLCKAVMFFFFLPIIIGLWVLQRRSFSTKNLCLNYSALILAFLFTISPWIIRNYTTFGTFNFTVRSGKALYNRALKLDYNLEETKKTIIFTFSEYLGAKFYPDAIDNPRDYLLREDILAEKRLNELIKAGYSEIEADRLFTQEAIEKIKKSPAKYLSQSFLEAIKMTAFLYLPLLNEPCIIKKFENLNHGRLILAILRSVFKFLGYLILLLAISGIFATRTKWREWYFITALIIYINLIYSLLFGWARYAVPLIPFYLIFAVVGFLRFWNKNLVG